MNNILMMLVSDISVLFFHHVLVMLMNDLPLLLGNNRCLLMFCEDSLLSMS